MLMCSKAHVCISKNRGTVIGEMKPCETFINNNKISVCRDPPGT